MKKHLVIFVTSLLIVAGLLITTVTAQVDSNEVALIKTFGATTKVIRGSEDAGLHFKWPWPVQRMVKYNASWNVLQDQVTELSLVDKNVVLVNLYGSWRVADPEKFNQTVDTIRGGEEAIKRVLNDFKGSVLGRYQMGALVNTDSKQMMLQSIEDQILKPTAAKVRQDYGIELSRIGTRMLGLPQNVTDAVIKAQGEERSKVAKSAEARGESMARAIRDRARSDSDQIIAFADSKAKAIEQEGMAAAAAHYEIFATAPELAMFLVNIDSLKTAFKQRTDWIIDDSQMPAIKMVRDGPLNMPVPRNLKEASKMLPATQPKD